MCIDTQAFAYVCRHACMHIYMCIYIYIYIHIYIQTHTERDVHIYTYIHIYIYICTCIWICFVLQKPIHLGSPPTPLSYLRRARKQVAEPRPKAELVAWNIFRRSGSQAPSEPSQGPKPRGLNRAGASYLAGGRGSYSRLHPRDVLNIPGA